MRSSTPTFLVHSSDRPSRAPWLMLTYRRSRTRSTLPEPPEPPPKHIRIAWAELLRRTFAIDALACPRCDGGRMRLVATIKDKAVIDKILSHLGLPTDPPRVSPARAPPQLDFDDSSFA